MNDIKGLDGRGGWGVEFVVGFFSSTESYNILSSYCIDGVVIAAQSTATFFRSPNLDTRT